MYITLVHLFLRYIKMLSMHRLKLILIFIQHFFCNILDVKKARFCFHVPIQCLYSNTLYYVIIPQNIKFR